MEKFLYSVQAQQNIMLLTENERPLEGEYVSTFVVAQTIFEAMEMFRRKYPDFNITTISLFGDVIL